MRYLPLVALTLTAAATLPLAERLGSDRLRIGPGQALAWSPDGTRIATGGWSLRVEVTDAQTGARIWETHLGFDHVIDGVAWSPDGTRVAAATRRNEIVLLDAKDGTVARRIDAQTRHVSGVAFSPDGKEVLASDSLGGVRAFRVADGSPTAPFAGTCGEIEVLGQSADRKTLVSGAYRGDVCTWSVAKRAIVHSDSKAHHFNPATLVSLTGDGRLQVSSGGDRWIRVYLDGVDRGPALYLDGLDGATVSSNGRLAVVEQGRLCLLEPGFLGRGPLQPSALEAACAHPLATGLARVQAMAFSPDGQRLAIRTSSVLQILTLAGGAVDAGEGQRGEGIGVAFAGATLVSAGEDDRVLLWQAGKVAAALGTPGDPLGSLAVGGDVAVTAAWRGPIHVYSVSARREVVTLHHGKRDWVNAVAVSPDGAYVASAGNDGAVRLWSPATGEKLATLQDELGWEHEVKALAFAPDGRTLYGGAKLLQSWQIPSGKPGRTWSLAGRIGAIAVAPDGRRVAAGTDLNEITLFSVDAEAPVATWTAHKYSLAGLAFVDGERLASIGLDESLRLWRVPSGALLAEVDHRGPGKAVAVSPDRSQLVLIGADGVVMAYRIGR